MCLNFNENWQTKWSEIMLILIYANEMWKFKFLAPVRPDLVTKIKKPFNFNEIYHIKIILKGNQTFKAY